MKKLILFLLVGCFILITGCSGKEQPSAITSSEQTDTTEIVQPAVSIQNTTSFTLKEITIKVNDDYETELEKLPPFSNESVSLSSPNISSDSSDPAIQSIAVNCDRGDGTHFGNCFYKPFSEPIILTIDADENNDLFLSINSVND